MDRYAVGSKEIVRTINGKPTIVGDSPFLNDRSVVDLMEIRCTLEDEKVRIDDLQFLIGEDRSVVIADPLAVRPGVKPSPVDLRTIDRLIEVAGG
jgi:hypothetical protein